MNVVGIAGSLRRGSLNRALLRAAVELAPAGLDIIPHDLGDIPLRQYLTAFLVEFAKWIERVR